MIHLLYLTDNGDIRDTVCMDAVSETTWMNVEETFGTTEMVPQTLCIYKN